MTSKAPFVTIVASCENPFSPLSNETNNRQNGALRGEGMVTERFCALQTILYRVRIMNCLDDGIHVKHAPFANGINQMKSAIA